MLNTDNVCTIFSIKVLFNIKIIKSILKVAVFLTMGLSDSDSSASSSTEGVSVKML